MTKILIDRSTVEQALEALEYQCPIYAKATIESLKAALVEPVAWGLFAKVGGEFVLQHPVRFSEADAKKDRLMFAPDTVIEIRPLYTSPPQRPAEPVEDTDDKAASIRWQLCLLAQTEEFSDDVRNQIGRGVWLIDRLTEAALAEPQEPDSPERRCGGPGCDMKCCQPVQEPMKLWPLAPLTGYYDVGGKRVWLEQDEPFPQPAPPQRPAEPVQEPQGCDHCNHPLYAAVKCRVCGRVTEPTPPQRKPLAEWQINDLMADIDPEDRDSWSFRQGVYAAEKHHGVRK